MRILLRLLAGRPQLALEHYVTLAAFGVVAALLLRSNCAIGPSQSVYFFSVFLELAYKHLKIVACCYPATPFDYDA